MSKERLEEINNFSSLPLKKRISLTKESIKKELKANDYHMPKNININTQYLLEIIEQAERVQELETQLSINTNNMKHLQNKIERYKQALENITISSIPLEIDDAVNIALQALEVSE